MKNEFNGDKVVEALNEWKDASKDRKLFAVLEDEDSNMAIVGRGEDLSKLLACALYNDDRVFFICNLALDLATLAKQSEEVAAKTFVEE